MECGVREEEPHSASDGGGRDRIERPASMISSLLKGVAKIGAAGDPQEKIEYIE
jgi:hypothetical protein